MILNLPLSTIEYTFQILSPLRGPVVSPSRLGGEGEVNGLHTGPLNSTIPVIRDSSQPFVPHNSV